MYSSCAQRMNYLLGRTSYSLDLITMLGVRPMSRQSYLNTATGLVEFRFAYGFSTPEEEAWFRAFWDSASPF